MKNAINNFFLNLRTIRTTHPEIFGIIQLLLVGGLVTAGLMLCFGLVQFSR